MTETTAFFDAVRRGDVEAVDELLHDQASLASATNEGGVSALLWAFYNGQPRIAERLLASGVELNIFEAAAAGDASRASALLARDPLLADANSPDGFSALGLAAFFGRPEVLTLLLNEGADPNAASRNAMRVTPLHSAAAHGEPQTSLRMMEILLRSGADPNVQQHGGWTPLHQAAAHGRIEAVALLLAHGADSTSASVNGKTPAEMAAAAGYAEVERRLGEKRGGDGSRLSPRPLT
ncbi:MAG TPA: ankyrin repeat domain-containing protein [Gemmatimonadaceae bacterium]|jgi:FOG: Ankyrin repeat